MKKIIFSTLLLTGYIAFILPITVRADVVIDNGINFLKSKQNSSGNITNGFSSPAQWSAIALTANGVDVTTIKNSTTSLKDFLLTDIPTNNPAATDWETRILAIVAIGGDPTNFGGVNYVQNLETFYTSNQIGDTCSLNDDIFGLLALIASGSTSNTQIKQDTLNFIISKQDSNGGFGFSAPGCPYYQTAPDMTGAAIQALQEAKDNNLTAVSLDDTIAKAKNYLLSNQDTDGGFGYSGSSDADTTGWVLMAFNILGEEDSAPAVNARNWLLTRQSNTDGGFLTFNYSSNTYVSDSTTTAQALIALSGKGWILRIFTPSINPTPIPSATATPSATLTPTSTPMPSATLTPSSPTPTPSTTGAISSPMPTLTPVPTPIPSIVSTPTPSPMPIVNSVADFHRDVLGATIENPVIPSASIQPYSRQKLDQVIVQSFGLQRSILWLISGVSFVAAYFYWKLVIRRTG